MAPTAKQIRDNRFFTGVIPPTASIESRIISNAMSRHAIINFSSLASIISQQHVIDSDQQTLEERLFTVRASCKITTNQFAMHFGPDWQRSFFAQLDLLLNKDDWDPLDIPVTDNSFLTLIRLLLTQRGKRRPGLGLANGGNIVAAWTAGTNRLTVICLPNDRVRWVISRAVDDEIETAGGDVNLINLIDRLSPYNPDQWFSDEGSKTSA